MPQDELRRLVDDLNARESGVVDDPRGRLTSAAGVELCAGAQRYTDIITAFF